MFSTHYVYLHELVYVINYFISLSVFFTLLFFFVVILCHSTLEREEFETAVKAVNPEATQSELEDYFNYVDQDYNNSISFIEFLASMLDPRDVDIQDMKEVLLFLILFKYFVVIF